MTAESIMIVDDDPSVGRALVRLMTSLDIRCWLCASGDEMLAMVGTARPTLVLLDINMPRKSGVDALRQMRDRGIDVPTVMMTGAERDSLRESCLAAGAIDVLAKPVESSAITRLIASIRGIPQKGQSC